MFIIFFKWVEFELLVIEKPILEPAKEKAFEKLRVIIKFEYFLTNGALDKLRLKST